MPGSVNAFPRRNLLQGGAALASAGLLHRPALAQGAAGTLRLVPHANLHTLDSLQSSALIALTAAMAIWDQLFALDSKLVPQPQMVESYELSDDRLHWRFAYAMACCSTTERRFARPIASPRSSAGRSGTCSDAAWPRN